MKKIILDENDIPKQWYNIQADLPNPVDPPLNPKTHKPVGPEELGVIFPMGLIKQEVSQERFIDIGVYKIKNGVITYDPPQGSITTFIGVK